MKEILNNSWLIIVCLLVGSALFMGAVTASLYMINYPSTIVFYTGCIMLIMTIASYIYWMNAGALKGPGYLGDVSNSGRMVTEYSSSVPARYLSRNTDSNREIESPTIVPTLSKGELSLATMQANGEYPIRPEVAQQSLNGYAPRLRQDYVPMLDSTNRKAADFARTRLSNGLPPYYHLY